MPRTILKTIPLLSPFASSEMQLQKLAGLSNENYLITIKKNPKQKYILRIPRESSNSFINRENESHNAEIAEQLNIAPENLWRNTSGISLTEYIESASIPYLGDSKTLEKMAKTLATLHDSKTAFKGVLNNQKISKSLTQYFKLCSTEQQQVLKADYQKTLLFLESVLCKRPAVPSHVDLVLENSLLQAEKVWLIDWEYSAMASPFWDIATLCNAADFNSTQSENFLKMTIKNYQKSDLKYLKQYRFITKTVSDCWQTAFLTPN